jgi:Aspartyl protease
MKSVVRFSSAVIALAVSGSAMAAEPVVLKIEPWRRAVAIRAEVGGKERLFQFDTGGGITIISPALAKELGCEKGARLVGYRMTGDKLDTPRCDNVAVLIGGHRFNSPVAGVYETGQLAAKEAAGTVDGLIALDIFAGRTVTLDFAGGRIILETPESARARMAKGTELPARLGKDISGRATAVYIDVPSKIGTLEFELDSGNGGTILVGKTYAPALGFDPDKGPVRGKIDLGPGIAAEGVIFPAGITLDGNLGMPFLKDYLVTLDLDRGRAWFARNPTPPPAGMGVPPEVPKS